MTSSQAASLRGRLSWARSFLFGRYGSAALVPLRIRQYDEVGTTKMSNAMESALVWFRQLLGDMPQREMLFNVSGKRLVVTVSDGEGSGSVAVGIWLPREKFQPRLAHVDIPSAWLERWSDYKSRKNVIMEIEGVRPLIALTT